MGIIIPCDLTRAQLGNSSDVVMPGFEPSSQFPSTHNLVSLSPWLRHFSTVLPCCLLVLAYTSWPISWLPKTLTAAPRSSLAESEDVAGAPARDAKFYAWTINPLKFRVTCSWHNEFQNSYFNKCLPWFCSRRTGVKHVLHFKKSSIKPFPLLHTLKFGSHHLCLKTSNPEAVFLLHSDLLPPQKKTRKSLVRNVPHTLSHPFSGKQLQLGKGKISEGDKLGA